ncbi:hypothetical protein SUGI_0489280 [Cryptomeria japonica]|uniref:uncharacterized protein LOC131035226 n=1 Tax=Cryptomeria japonica TaxID=3369 RepID=UPI002408EE9A|nr:uncharacterized protein LOC131035226 [Cryptomeria japonica]XP_057822871.2 uncharacterized protein LOC131035226 [Cryptomeria japonica]XP_057822872.2 uncharacterized protein LOC131035226 [Cryptomeria japonica]GLJ25550.1 hypothetical protein SUGI_0489280 [Cryptomeria japonica]
MQSLAACRVRFLQLNNSAKSCENFEVHRSGKDGKAFFNLAEGFSVHLRSLSRGVAVNDSRRSWKIPVSTQDEMSSGDTFKDTIPDDLKTSHKEQGQPLVKVKFVLQKKCKFGQQFAVVGDDPQFGTWNPKEALPLEWSEGDEWTTEVGVPMGKQIEYKFILKGKLGESSWQPGPNQVFDTLEDVPSMVVSSIWEKEKETTETSYEEKVLELTSTEITEQGIKDADLGEIISLNTTTDQGAVTVEPVDVDDSPNGVFGASTKDTDGNINREYPTFDYSEIPDELSPHSGEQKERGAASTSETM